MRQLTLHIEGMSCGHCLHAVQQALTRLPGVERPSVRMGRAEVEYDEDRISEGEIIAAVSAAGYRATAQSVA